MFLNENKQLLLLNKIKVISNLQLFLQPLKNPEALKIVLAEIGSITCSCDIKILLAFYKCVCDLKLLVVAKEPQAYDNYMTLVLEPYAIYGIKF